MKIEKRLTILKINSIMNNLIKKETSIPRNVQIISFYIVDSWKIALILSFKSSYNGVPK